MHFIFNSAAGIFRIGFYSKTNSLNGNTSLAAVDSAVYSASVVDIAISVWRRLAHVFGQPAYCIIHLVLYLTECGSSLVSDM